MKKYYYEGPAFKLWGSLGVPLLNFEGGPGVPLLNFRGIPGPNFKLWEGSRVPGPGVLVPLLQHARYSEKLFSYWGNPDKNKQTNNAKNTDSTLSFRATCNKAIEQPRVFSIKNIKT